MSECGMKDADMQLDAIHGPIQKLHKAYEQVTSKKSLQHDEDIWKSILDGLHSGHDIRLMKQIRFLSVLYEVYEQNDLKLLPLITDILSVLRCKYQHIFHPTLDALIILFTNCAQHDALTECHQAFIGSVLAFLDQLLSNQSPRKSFELVCNKMLVPWANIRSRLDDCTVIDNIIFRYLFSQSLINEFWSSNNSHDVDEPAAAKKGRFQSYTSKLFSNVKQISLVIPILFQHYLQSSQKYPNRDEVSESKRYSADINIALAFLDLISESTSSDHQLILFESMFTMVHQYRLYHPNRDTRTMQRSKFISYLDSILLGLNPELIFSAVSSLLRIDHMFVEDRLISIWKLVGDHYEKNWSKSLATDIVIAYTDLRQISVAFRTFLQSFIDLKLSSLIPATIFLRIPVPQLSLIIEEFLPELDTCVNPIAVADVFTTILDTMRDQIPDKYQQIVASLNSCSQLPLDQRISIYTAARRTRSRRGLATLLPKEINSLPFDFLSDLDNVDHDLLFSYERLTPGIITAVVYCLDDIHCRSLLPLYAIGIRLVRRVSQCMTPENWHLISAHVELLLIFAEPDAIDVIADFIVHDNLQLLLMHHSLLENRQLRSALVLHLTRSICEQPALINALSELPIDYLDNHVFEPVALVIFKTISQHHPIWIHVACLKQWPLMKLEANALVLWILSSSSANMLLKLVLSQRLSELVKPAARIITSRSSIDLLCVIVEAVVDHLHYSYSSCSEAFYRPIDQIPEKKPTFAITDVIYDAIDIIVDGIPQERHNDSTLNLISLLLQFQTLSSSEFTGTRSVVIKPIVDRIPSLIGSVQNASPTYSSRLFMASIASAMRSIDTPNLCQDALRNWLIRDPFPKICSAFCEASKPSDFEAMLVFLRPNLPSSKNAVLVLSHLMSHIRYRTGHCRIVDKLSTSLINGLGSAISQGIDDAIDALFAMVNHLQSVKLSVHQVALIVSALHPAMRGAQTSDKIFCISRLLFALVRYRQESIVPSLPVFCEHLILLFRFALQSQRSNVNVLDNISRVFAELSRSQAVAALSPRLIAEYFRTMALKPLLDVEERQAATQGVMALFDIADREQIQAAYGALDPPCQALFQTCHKEFLRTYKYYGRS